MSTRTRFEEEAKGNSEMAYCGEQLSKLEWTTGYSNNFNNWLAIASDKG